ncbi:hypothetical protein [Bacillus sp. J37]|uniref:hypothetical protein n=1 Tax=Bacillus sp. J37 TaxID=935837 RepID=UPI00047EB8EF|nr:hypothetical protein [Bacillus sp. J37]
MKSYQTIVIIKIMLIWYLLLVSAGLLTTSTGAYYSNQKEANGSMTIGTWESEHEKEKMEKEIERAKEIGEEQEIQLESAAEHTTDE